MFTVGDKVVHPLHGAGEITELVEREVDGQQVQYYALRLAMDDVVIFLPVGNCETLGIHPVCSRTQAEQLLGEMAALDCAEEKGWNQRYRENMLHIRSGNLLEVAQVIKTLTCRDRKHGLSTGEKKILLSARRILISELAFALDCSAEQAGERVDDILSGQPE